MVKREVTCGRALSVLALSLTLACASHTSSISVVPGSERTFVRPAAGPSEKPLELRSFRIAVPATSSQYDILLAWEPAAGTYWWVWQAPSDDPRLEKFPGRGTTLFTGDGRIAVIIPQTPPTLHFRASARHASSVERAREKVLAQIERDPALMAGPQSGCDVGGRQHGCRTPRKLADLGQRRYRFSRHTPRVTPRAPAGCRPSR